MTRLIDRMTPSGVTAERAAAVRVYETFAGDTPSDDGLASFKSYVETGYQTNGVVFAAVGARARLLSEIEFKFRDLQTGELFGTPALSRLERPWPNGSTGDLVFRLEQAGSLQGNGYVLSTPNGWQVLNPSKVQVVSDGMWVAGYLYWSDGIGVGRSRFLPVDDVAHYAPNPDPLRPYLGMSWMTAVASEILGDRDMEAHRRKFFSHAATPNMIVKIEQSLQPEDRHRLEEAVSRRYSGDNAWKTMIIDQGADVQVVGSSFADMQFVDVQAQGEIRVCQAAGVPPQLIGTQLGLKSSTFTNYTQAFRWFVDATIRPLWRSMAKALETIVDVPAGAELWYDDRRVPALQQDAKDQADIFDANARTIGALIRAGWTADSSRDAVLSGNFGVLEHTGLMPNTLQHDDDGQSPGDEDAEPGDPNEDI